MQPPSVCTPTPYTHTHTHRHSLGSVICTQVHVDTRPCVQCTSGQAHPCVLCPLWMLGMLCSLKCPVTLTQPFARKSGDPGRLGPWEAEGASRQRSRVGSATATVLSARPAHCPTAATPDTRHRHPVSAQPRDQADPKTRDPGGFAAEETDQDSWGCGVACQAGQGKATPAGVSLALRNPTFSASWDWARLTKGICCPGPGGPLSLQPVQKAGPRGLQETGSRGSDRSLGSLFCDPANPGWPLTDRRFPNWPCSPWPHLPQGRPCWAWRPGCLSSRSHWGIPPAGLHPECPARLLALIHFPGPSSSRPQALAAGGWVPGGPSPFPRLFWPPAGGWGGRDQFRLTWK